MAVYESGSSAPRKPDWKQSLSIAIVFGSGLAIGIVWNSRDGGLLHPQIPLDPGSPQEIASRGNQLRGDKDPDGSSTVEVAVDEARLPTNGIGQAPIASRPLPHPLKQGLAAGSSYPGYGDPGTNSRSADHATARAVRIAGAPDRGPVLIFDNSAAGYSRIADGVLQISSEDPAADAGAAPTAPRHRFPSPSDVKAEAPRQAYVARSASVSGGAASADDLGYAGDTVQAERRRPAGEVPTARINNFVGNAYGGVVEDGASGESMQGTGELALAVGGAAPRKLREIDPSADQPAREATIRMPGPPAAGPGNGDAAPGAQDRQCDPAPPLNAGGVSPPKPSKDDPGADGSARKTAARMPEPLAAGSGNGDAVPGDPARQCDPARQPDTGVSSSKPLEVGPSADRPVQGSAARTLGSPAIGSDNGDVAPGERDRQCHPIGKENAGGAVAAHSGTIETERKCEIDFQIDTDTPTNLQIILAANATDPSIPLTSLLDALEPRLDRERFAQLRSSRHAQQTVSVSDLIRRGFRFHIHGSRLVMELV